MSSSVHMGLDSRSLLFSNDAFHLRDDFMHEKNVDNPGFSSSSLLDAMEKYENVGEEVSERVVDTESSSPFTSERGESVIIIILLFLLFV